jgi:hypothetical protein
MSYVIEKGAILPEKKEKDRFSFNKMKVGDCFTVTDYKESNCARYVMYRINKLGYRRFISRRPLQGWKFYRQT